MTEMSAPVTWNLQSFFPAVDSAEMDAFLQALRADVDGLISAATGERTIEFQELADLLLRQESAEGRLRHLSAYLHCVYSEGHRSEALSASAAVELKINAAFEAAVAALAVLIGKLGEQQFEELLQLPQLEGLSWRLSRLRAEADSRLSHEEERLAADLLVDSLHGWSTLANRTFQSMSFDAVTADGKPTSVPFAQRYEWLWSRDTDVRRAAYRGIQSAIAANETVLAACLNGMTGARLTLLLHRSQDPIEEVHWRMGISSATMDLMMTVLRERRGTLHKYLDLKRQVLDLDRLELPDRWAPMGSSPILDPSAALNRVSSTLARYSPMISAEIERIRERDWIDYQPGPNKAGSCFCVNSPITGEPRVYMNTAGSLMGQTVLAHELGHGLHFTSLSGLRPWQHMVPSTLAETASITCEHLYRAGVLETEGTTHEQRVEVLATDLDGAVNYLLRIPRDYDFERSTYSARQQGELSADKLRALSRTAHIEWFGDVLAPEDHEEYSWALPLNFSTWTNFFNFPYVFGYLLSRAIANCYEARREEMDGPYRAFLRATGSMTCEEAAGTALGFDLTQRSFWEEAFQSVEKRLETFRKLVRS